MKLIMANFTPILLTPHCLHDGKEDRCNEHTTFQPISLKEKMYDSKTL